MKPLANDTHSEAEEVQIEIWRSWTPQQRLKCACNLMAFVRRRVEHAVREQHPGLTDAEVRLELLRRAYGDEIAAAVEHHLRDNRDA